MLSPMQGLKLMKMDKNHWINNSNHKIVIVAVHLVPHLYERSIKEYIKFQLIWEGLYVQLLFKFFARINDDGYVSYAALWSPTEVYTKGSVYPFISTN